MEIEAVLDAKGWDVFTIDPDDLVLLAIHEMASWDVGALVVTDNGRDIHGVISERDVTRGLLRHGCHVLSLRVRDVMSGDVATGRFDESAECWLARMTAVGQRHLVVVGEEGPCGVVTVGDLVRGGYRHDVDPPGRLSRRTPGAARGAALIGSVR